MWAEFLAFNNNLWSEFRPGYNKQGVKIFRQQSKVKISKDDKCENQLLNLCLLCCNTWIFKTCRLSLASNTGKANYFTIEEFILFTVLSRITFSYEGN